MTATTAPRAYRKIALTLSFINAPVALYTAIEKPKSNTTVCVGKEGKPHDPTAIKQTQACPLPDCGNDDKDSFRKVAPTAATGVLVDADEVKAIKELASKETKDTVALTPHPVESIRANTIPYGGVYYLGCPATGKVREAWDGLVDAMERHPELAFLGTWSPAGKPNLYEFRLYGKDLLMVQVARTEEIKVVTQERGEVDAAAQAAMDMFLTMTAKAFDPADYASEFDAKMRELLASKAPEDQVTLTRSSSGTKATPAMDFTEALTASIASLQLVGGTDTEPAKKPAKKRAKKATVPAADVA